MSRSSAACFAAEPVRKRGRAGVGISARRGRSLPAGMQHGGRGGAGRMSIAQSHGFVGRSRALADVVRRIELVAATASTVLITGETGTGKELVARAVHPTGARGDRA